MDIFEQASRKGLTFSTSKGTITTDDLWSLPLTSKREGITTLDSIARELNKRLNSDENVSFVLNAQKQDETVQLKFDIVKHIINVKQFEDTVRVKEHENAEKKQRILQLINEKKDEKLKEMSIEELNALKDSLE